MNVAVLPVLLSLFQASAVADLSASCDEFDQQVSLLSGGKLARLLSSVFFFPSKDSSCLNCTANQDSDAGQATIYNSSRVFYAQFSIQATVSSINCDNHLGYGCLVNPLEDATLLDIMRHEPHACLKPFGLRDEAPRSHVRQSAAALMDTDGAEPSRKSSFRLYLLVYRCKAEHLFV